MSDPSVVLMSLFYVAAGFSHFRSPKFFLSITPPWVPNPKMVNRLVGISEVILGVSLWFPPFRSLAALGIIFLLIMVFPANVYHFIKAKRKKKNVILTAVRLPIQFLLIYWAYTLI